MIAMPRSQPKFRQKRNGIEFAALGAFVMLARIAKGESFSVIEFHGNMSQYARQIADAKPEMLDDPWFGPFLKQYLPATRTLIRLHGTGAAYLKG
jgi:hypothetical protein